MKRTRVLTLSWIALLLLVLASCKEDDPDTGTGELDQLAIVTNITTGSTPIAYLGTRADFSAGSYTNAKARQTLSYPLAQTYDGDIYLCEARSGNNLIKYKRNADGTLSETARLSLPTASTPYWIAFESKTKAYLTLGAAGKIAIINPETMTQTGSIDLSAYAIGDNSPDPSVIIYREQKLYIACFQSSDTYSSVHPAQVLIVDLANGNKITSTTDSRTTFASSPSSLGSMFFTENGDLYLLCAASFGFKPGQKCGFLRILKGSTTFDPDYFFNVSDYNVAGIAGNRYDYLHRLEYAGNGIVYGIANVPALVSNPPDYINDKSFSAFKADLTTETITKLDIPFSNGFAGSVLLRNSKAYFGMSTNTGVGIYSYDPATNQADQKPLIATEGDASILLSF